MISLVLELNNDASSSGSSFQSLERDTELLGLVLKKKIIRYHNYFVFVIFVMSNYFKNILTFFKAMNLGVPPAIRTNGS